MLNLDQWGIDNTVVGSTSTSVPWLPNPSHHRIIGCKHKHYVIQWRMPKAQDQEDTVKLWSKSIATDFCDKTQNCLKAIFFLTLKVLKGNSDIKDPARELSRHIGFVNGMDVGYCYWWKIACQLQYLLESGFKMSIHHIPYKTLNVWYIYIYPPKLPKCS